MGVYIDLKLEGRKREGTEWEPLCFYNKYGEPLSLLCRKANRIKDLLMTLNEWETATLEESDESDGRQKEVTYYYDFLSTLRRLSKLKMSDSGFFSPEIIARYEAGLLEGSLIDYVSWTNKDEEGNTLNKVYYEWVDAESDIAMARELLKIIDYISDTYTIYNMDLRLVSELC